MREGHREKEYDIPSHTYTRQSEEKYVALVNGMRIFLRRTFTERDFEDTLRVGRESTEDLATGRCSGALRVKATLFTGRIGCYGAS